MHVLILILIRIKIIYLKTKEGSNLTGDQEAKNPLSPHISPQTPSTSTRSSTSS